MNLPRPSANPTHPHLSLKKGGTPKSLTQSRYPTILVLCKNCDKTTINCSQSLKKQCSYQDFIYLGPQDP